MKITDALIEKLITDYNNPPVIVLHYEDFDALTKYLLYSSELKPGEFISTKSIRFDLTEFRCGNRPTPVDLSNGKLGWKFE